MEVFFRVGMGQREHFGAGISTTVQGATCCGQSGLAMGLSPCSSGGHPDKTFHGLFLTSRPEEKRDLTQNGPERG